MLIDTHCHLDFAPLCEQLPTILYDAAQLGVTQMLTIGCDLASSEKAIDIARHHPPSVFAAVGIHPNETAAHPDIPSCLAQLESLANSTEARAIGEIGLDYYRDRAPRSLQKEWLHHQWHLAQSLGLPVILHCREAMSDLLEIVQQWRTPSDTHQGKGEKEIGIMHCFSGSPDEVQTCLESGLLIGVGGPVTYPKSDALREAVLSVPLDKLVIETDAPFLAPQKRRGQTNQPGFCRYTAEFVAELKGISLEELASATSNNARRLLNLPGPSLPG